MVNGEAGKGDSPRKVDPKKYASNFDKIFSKSKNKKAKGSRKKK